MSSSRSSSSSSSQATTGAALGCDRVFSGLVRDAVGFKKFFDRAIRSAHPVQKVDFFDGMRASDRLIEKIGIEKALFRLGKNARFAVRSEIALFDPSIRLHKNWPNSGKYALRACGLIPRVALGHLLICNDLSQCFDIAVFIIEAPKLG